MLVATRRHVLAEKKAERGKETNWNVFNLSLMSFSVFNLIFPAFFLQSFNFFANFFYEFFFCKTLTICMKAKLVEIVIWWMKVATCSFSQEKFFLLPLVNFSSKKCWIYFDFYLSFFSRCAGSIEHDKKKFLTGESLFFLTLIDRSAWAFRGRTIP